MAGKAPSRPEPAFTKLCNICYKVLYEFFVVGHGKIIVSVTSNTTHKTKQLKTKR